MIDNYFPYEKDELMYSWFARLAKANALTVNEFMSLYVFGENIEHAYKHKFRKDTSYNMDHFCTHIPKLDPLTLYTDTSILPGLLPLMSAPNNSKLLARLQINYHDKRLDMIEHLKYCPECRKADMEATKHAVRGPYSWLRRSHNMPGVTVCHIHNIPLIEASAFDGTNITNGALLPVYEKSYDYALTAAWLLNSNLSYEWDDFQSCIKEYLFAKGWINKDGADSSIFVKDFNPYLELLSDDKKLKIFYSSRRNPTATQAIAMISCFCRKNMPITEEPSLLEEVCPNCHKKYISSKHRHNMGYRCPDCDTTLSTQDFLKRIDNDSYRLISEDKEQITLFHTSCGTTFSTTKKDFFILGSRCHCIQRLTFEEAEKQLPAGFKLISYSQHDVPAVVMKETCGHIFPRTLGSLKRNNAICPICSKERFSLEGFIKELRDIRGDEFTVLDDTYVDRTTKIKVRHNPCGRIFYAEPMKLLLGLGCTCQAGMSFDDACSRVPSGFKLISYTGTDEMALFEAIGCKHQFNRIFKKFVTRKDMECPICKKERNNLESFIQNVKNTFGDEYAVDKSTFRTMTSPVKITHNKCGKTDTYLPYLFLKSHGCSCMKPLLADGPSKDMYKYLITNYDDTEPIILEDLIKKFPSGKTQVRHLTKKGLLFRQMPGVYTLSDTILTSQSMFEAIYLKRKKQHIGYTSGSSFAFELGLIDEKPHVVSIVSNREAQKHGRTIHNCAIDIKIHGPRVNITNENWKQLQALDFANTFHKVISKDREMEVFAALKYYLTGISIQSFESLYEYYPSWMKNKITTIYGISDCAKK